VEIGERHPGDRRADIEGGDDATALVDKRCGNGAYVVLQLLVEQCETIASALAEHVSQLIGESDGAARARRPGCRGQEVVEFGGG
jgi:hypothetical protein